ncbi:MAG TPA: acyl-CoA thioesterase [Fimbriimonadales bacterium]|nr:acyl-CoA thioesterase [Fimbriimonadales bacterium]
MKEEKTAKTVRETEVRMSELMTPEHANFLGNVFGGTILALLDKCAYVTASRFAGKVCVTASFDRVDFHSPIEVGELVHMIGSVAYVGRTSIQVWIQVYAENVQTGIIRHTNTCSATLVAIDERGKPTPVPRLKVETREDKVRYLEGKLRRELREIQRLELENLIQQIHSLSDEELDEKIRN